MTNPSKNLHKNCELDYLKYTKKEHADDAKRNKILPQTVHAVLMGDYLHWGEVKKSSVKCDISHNHLNHNFGI